MQTPDYLKPLEKRFTQDMSDTIVSYIATLHRETLERLDKSGGSIFTSKSETPELESEFSSKSTDASNLSLAHKQSDVSPKASLNQSPKPKPEIPESLSKLFPESSSPIPSQVPTEVSTKSSPSVSHKSLHKMSPKASPTVSPKMPMSPDVPYINAKRPLRFKVSKVEEKGKEPAVNDFDVSSLADDDFESVQFSKPDNIDIQNTQL